MKSSIKILGFALLTFVSAGNALAQIGKPFIHDPSTIMECEGKYYTFGTRGGGLISEDGWTWNSGAERPGGGAAPDAIKIGNRYLIVYGSTGGGLGGGHDGKINTMWNKTLDPKSPDFKFSDPIVVAESKNMEDNDAIDPGLLLDPITGRLWVSYGTYFGNIRLVELDPKTGDRVKGNKALDIAIDCEATDLEYRDGWYYLLGTHGTCCDGANSTYNIVVGRSKKVTGPYLDNMGRDMLRGGGKMVVSSGGGRTNGAGHFGRTILENGVEKVSLHYEADLDRSGRSVLAIKPLLWKNGWPYAGENLKDGTYQIESERRGYALELIVDFVRMARTGGGFGPNAAEQPIVPVPSQQLSDVSSTWPAGNIDVRIGDYVGRPHQKWNISAVADAPGFFGTPSYKILIEGTERALAATADAELVTVPSFTGAPEQLWRIDQLTDGTFRIMPKVVPNSDKKLALISAGDSTPTLGEFDMNSDNSKWNFKAP
ncbi:MAG: family 43 glycosylhydrolase [Saprospiraceae bacterium]|nr:family 43 glycosylhydrolase [Saprospiraceae bacterium]